MEEMIVEEIQKSGFPKEIKLVRVQIAEMAEFHETLEPWYEKIVDGMHGKHTVGTLIKRIASGDLWMWCVITDDGEIHATIGTEILTYPSGLKTFMIRWVTGANRKMWLHLLDTLEDCAHHYECERIEAWARQGWVKHLPDYQMKHIEITKDL